MGCVPATAAAFPLCTARDSLCNKKEWERWSPDIVAARDPISLHSSVADGPHVPMVSIATGANMKSPDETSSVYLVLLFISAVEAANPTVVADWPTCDGGHRVGADKASSLLLLHARRIAPSGLLPSSLKR